MAGLPRSSTPTKRPVTPKRSASDENDQYYEQMGARKPVMAKHYMSPTISAASKAVASRKTILGERNEASLEPVSPKAHVEKSGISGDDSLSPAMQLSPFVDDEKRGHSDGLASKPYDPVTNYLSPRPKFLRYRPNRRREIFLGLESSISERDYELSFSTSGSFESEKGAEEEGVGGAAVSPSSLACGFVKQEEVEAVEGSDEESDGETEEVEEEKGWCLKGVLKSLLVLLVVVFFASHVAPMNQQILSEVVEGGHFGTRNATIGADLLKKLESGASLWGHREEGHVSLVEVIRGGLEMGAEEVNVVENESGGEAMGQAEETENDPMAEQQVVIEEGVKDEGHDEDKNMGGVECMDEPRQVLELQVEAIEAIAVTEEEKKGGIDEVGEVVVLQAKDIEGTSDQVVDNSELGSAADEPYQKRPMSDDVDHHNQVSDVSKTFEEEGEFAEEKIVEIDVEGLETIDSGDTDFEEVLNSEAEGEVAEEKIDEMVVEGLETMDNGDTDFEEVLDSEAEGNWSWREELINHMKSQTFYIPILGVSLFSVIVASLLLVFRLKPRIGVTGNPSATPLVLEQNKINENASSLPLKPYSEPVVAEKYNSVLPSRGEDRIEHVYSSFRRMSSSSKHSAEEHIHTRAPSVQLLGEVSSSLRTCSMKTKMTENEESNYSLSSKMNLGSKVHSVSIQSQPSVSEFSSTASPSYESYTPQKIRKQKEGGKDGEVTSTPLRRSNRLRSRSVTSP